MITWKGVFTVFLVLSLISIQAQQKDSLFRKLDSQAIQDDTVTKSRINLIDQKSYTENTRLTFSTYFITLGSSFKQHIILPFQTSGKEWRKGAAFAMLYTALSFGDEAINKFALDLRAHNPTLISTSRFITNTGGTAELYTLAALGAYGLVFKNEKIKTTTLLATQAFLTTNTASALLKFVSGRQRPNYIDPKTNESEPAFHGLFYQFQKENGKKKESNSFTGFPSGHTALAFAAATVYAMEYQDRPIVPIISYGVASLIGLSRVTENKHWPTDVLVGAALGHLSGRLVVNNYHKYARLKSQHKQNTLSLSIQSINGRVLPGVIYHLN